VPPRLAKVADAVVEGGPEEIALAIQRLVNNSV